MKISLLAIAAVTAATLHAARAQVTPGAPVYAPPYEDVPPAEAAPEPAEAPPPPPAEPPPPPPPPPAPAAPPPLGAEKQLLVSIDLPFMNQGPQFAIVRESTSMNGPTSTQIVVQPSIDYFVAQSLSIGAQLGFDRVTVKNGNNNFLPQSSNLAINGTNGGTTLSIEARVGYDLPLTDTLSVWPRFGLGYTYVSTRYIYSPNVTGHSIPLSVSVPLLWHPAAHFFLGVGPALITQLSNNNGGMDSPKTTDYGITALIGGAIGGG